MAAAAEATARRFYMQIQPDWSDAGGEDGCWLDVYERSVVGCSREVRASASTQFRLPLLSSPAAASVVAPASSEAESRAPAHLVEVTRREKRWIEVSASVPTGNAQLQRVRTVFQAPTDAFDLARSLSHPVNADAVASATGLGRHRQPDKPSLQLCAVDVSSDEQYAATGAADGTCLLWDMRARSQMLPLAGHVADVTAARFFPSAQVLLTGSLDFTLRIWSVTGHCAATLRGHHGGVEDVAIIGRGRNVASCGSDGLIQLWSCATQSAVARWANDANSAVHCLSLLQDTTGCLIDEDEAAGAPASANEAETEGKVLFAGLENGEVLGVDIRARSAALNLDGSSAILSCAASEASGSGGPMLFTGTEDGLLTAWDLRQTSEPMHVVSRSSSPIYSVVAASSPQPGNGVWTAHGDGASCYWQGFTVPGGDNGPHVSTELTGPQFDPVRGLAVAPRTGRVFTACRDGELREYIPHFLD